MRLRCYCFAYSPQGHRGNSNGQRGNEARKHAYSKFAEIIYNGFWFSPEMDFLMAAIEKSQELIDGSVHLCLYKGNIS